jgi:DNA-binding transcriptional ArsR family regulator
MTANINNPSEVLERIFHEPNRLSIMSVLCASDKKLSFNEIKKECSLTDGNLSRHLKVLEDAAVIAIKKKFVGNKPQTTVSISASGLERFNEYLAALTEVLNKAKKALKPERKYAPVIHGRTARA